MFQGIWSHDARTAYYLARDRSQRASIWAVPVYGGERRLLVGFDDPARQSHRDEFAADGERFYFTISRYESDIWKMELITDGGGDPASGCCANRQRVPAVLPPAE